MTNYIKFEPLRDEILNDVEYDGDTVNHFLGIVDSQPFEDVVEVVRCKECKDYIPVMFNGMYMHYGYCCNTHDSVIGNRHRYEGDFCSYGKRKEGAEE